MGEHLSVEEQHFAKEFYYLVELDVAGLLVGLVGLGREETMGQIRVFAGGSAAGPDDVATRTQVGDF